MCNYFSSDFNVSCQHGKRYTFPFSLEGGTEVMFASRHLRRSYATENTVWNEYGM